MKAKKSGKRKLRIACCLILIAIAVAGLTVGGEYLWHYLNNAPENAEQEEVEGSVEVPEEVKLPEKIDFQPVVDDWVQSVGGRKSVLIYDLERDEVVGKYQETETYSTASLYKLFVVYEGYLRLERGEWQADAPAGSTGKTILECLDLAIRESNSACAETLWYMIGRDEMDEIVKNNFKIMHTDIAKLSSTPQDINEMLKIYYQHEGITDEKLLARMKDSFLNQPKTTYNWRQGLPSGFTKAQVYNKVGWDFYAEGNYWNLYHDAAIVEFPEYDRHYIVVVMTSQVPFEKIKRLGSEIEEWFYQQAKGEVKNSGTEAQ